MTRQHQNQRLNQSDNKNKLKISTTSQVKDSIPTYVDTIGHRNAGNDDGQFNGPTDIAIDSSNNIYVMDAGNSRVQKFDSENQVVNVWGAAGDTDTETLQKRHNLAFYSIESFL